MHEMLDVRCASWVLAHVNSDWIKAAYRRPSRFKRPRVIGGEWRTVVPDKESPSRVELIRRNNFWREISLLGESLCQFVPVWYHSTERKRAGIAPSICGVQPIMFIDEQLRRKALVWNKARIIPGYDLNVWRYDENGQPIRYSDYGNRLSDFGWEIDHRVPLALGGSDTDTNLRALKARTNATLGGLLSGLKG